MPFPPPVKWVLDRVLLEYNDTSNLTGPWWMAELRSADSVDPTIKRVAKEAPGIFREAALQIFLPTLPPDFGPIELTTINAIFVRSDNFKALCRLKQVTGITGLATRGDTNNTRDALTVDDEYVQGLVTASQAAWEKRGEGIEVGSFARLLQGETSGFCGFVESIEGQRAKLRVDYFDRKLYIDTPTKNLKCLDDVPENRRCFYYGPEVAELEDPSLLIRHEPDPVPRIEDVETGAYKKLGSYKRGATISALIRRLQYPTRIEPLALVREIVRAMQAKEIRRPKNWTVVMCLLRATFPGGKLKTLGINEASLAALAPDIHLPISSSTRLPKAFPKKCLSRKSSKNGEKRGPKVTPRLDTDLCGCCHHERAQHTPYIGGRSLWALDNTSRAAVTIFEGRRRKLRLQLKS